MAMLKDTVVQGDLRVTGGMSAGNWEAIVNLIYPVGSIYMSVNSASPATLFGGTWEQIKGNFLYACEDTGITAGNTGGAKSVSYTPDGSVQDHTLTTTEMPSHTHMGYIGFVQPDSPNNITIGTYSFYINNTVWPAGFNSTTTNTITGMNWRALIATGTSGSNGAHNHGFTGAAATINTMPPYLSVYVWKRTA